MAGSSFLARGVVRVAIAKGIKDRSGTHKVELITDGLDRLAVWSPFKWPAGLITRFAACRTSGVC